jgi:hypothetical protein
LTVSRRFFLRHGFLAAAACAGSPLLAFGGRRLIGGGEQGEPTNIPLIPSPKSDNWRDHTAAMDHLGRNDFSGAVGSDFKVFTTGGKLPVWVKLLAVEDLPTSDPANPASFAVPRKGNGFAPSSTGFLLLFGGSSLLSQDTHLFEHQHLGRFALFTVPEGNGRQVYTAVVNRLDVAPIIAVPQGPGPKPPVTGRINAPAGTSAAEELPSRDLSKNPGGRKSALQD